MEERLKRTLDHVRLGILAKQRPDHPAAPVTSPSKIVQLHFWPEPARSVPNVVLRSALFSVTQGKGRRALKRTLVAATSDYQISYTGWQLDQADLEVWEELVHLCRLHPLGTRCDFSARGLLKALYRKPGKSGLEWLRDSFARLTANSVEIRAVVGGERVIYFGSLIQSGALYEETKRFVLNLNPELLRLYKQGYTAIDVDQRRALRSKPLALWLLGFYSTAKKPYPVKVETLHRLCGSNTAELWEFRRQLKAALGELIRVGFLRNWEIRSEDMVAVNTASSTGAVTTKRLGDNSDE